MPKEKEKFFISEVRRFLKYFNLLNWELDICRNDSDASFRGSCKLETGDDNDFPEEWRL